MTRRTFNTSHIQHMKIKFLLLVSAGALSQSLCQGQSTVNFAAGPTQRNVMIDAITPLPNGNYVEIGFFDSAFNVSANANNLSALDGAWHEFGFTTITSVFGQPNRFADSQSTADTLFDSQKICFWIFRTSNDSAPTPDFSNVTGYGIYSNTNSNWLFPNQGLTPPANTTSVSSSEVTEAFFGSFDVNSLFLAPIPEPSTMGLFAIGLGTFALGCLRRRGGI